VVCPETCKTCLNTWTCETCEPGYGLYQSMCVVCPSTTKLTNGICIPIKSPLETVTEVAKGVFDSGSTASRIFTMGRSLSVGLGLIAKIIQNVRYLNVSYPEEALNAFESYGTDLFELPIPEMLYEPPEAKDLPNIYAKYDISPSFLENYWQTIMTIFISLLCIFIIRVMQYLTRNQSKEHIIQVVLSNIKQTAANFFIIQIYSNLDDVIFFFLLDASTTKSNSPSARLSLSTAVIFLAVGILLVFFHCWILGKYQQAREQDALEAFKDKFHFIGTLFEDFKDDSAVKQSFFGILILRCVILVLIIMLLQPPWIQAPLLMLTNLAFLVFIIAKRPYKSLFDEVTQYFCEITVFVAYLSVLILSILDYKQDMTSTARSGLGKCIVFSGIALCLGGFIAQLIQIGGVLIEICKYLKKYWKNKKLPETSRSQTSRIDNDICESNSSMIKIANINSFHKNQIVPEPLRKLSNLSNDLEVSYANSESAGILNNKSSKNSNPEKSSVLPPHLIEGVEASRDSLVGQTQRETIQQKKESLNVENLESSGRHNTARTKRKFKRKPRQVEDVGV